MKVLFVTTLAALVFAPPTAAQLTNKVAITDNSFEEASQAIVSSDNKNVYMVAEKDNVLVTYTRDTVTGALSNKASEEDATNMKWARDVAISPDGKNVYVAGYESNAIVTWTRDSTTGALSNKVVTKDNTNLDGVNAVAVSPDNKNVYAISKGTSSASVVTFTRDTTTGALSNQVNLNRDNTWLNGGKDIIVSPDNKNVYVVAYSSRSIVAFTRDTTDGALSNQVNQKDNPGGALDGASQVAISPDGKNIYIACYVADGIVYYDRDPSDGSLSNKKTITDATNLDGANSVAVSPDGKSVYVTGSKSDTMVSFDRDATTGALTNKVVTKDSTNLDGARGVAVSPDNKNVYTVSYTSKTIVSFDRPFDFSCSSGQYKGSRTCKACTAVAGAASGATYTCTSALNSRVSACAAATPEKTAGGTNTADTCKKKGESNAGSTPTPASGGTGGTGGTTTPSSGDINAGSTPTPALGGTGITGVAATVMFLFFVAVMGL